MRQHAIAIVLACLASACGGSTSSDGDPDTTTDTISDTEVECTPVPPGCIDTCRDGDGVESHPWGVTARTCEVVTDEHGCPDLEFTNTDCAPGVCHVPDVGGAACTDPVLCDSATCSCPDGASCTCSLADCTVTCEGDCIVELDGAGGSVACAGDSWCHVQCTGSDCSTACGALDRCSQACEGAGCQMSCGSASSCEQDCDGTDCVLDCASASDCSQDCETPSECTCSGCS